MSDYISRTALRLMMYQEAFEKNSAYQKWDSGCWIRYKLFERCVEAVPAADVVQVRHGRWLPVDDKMDAFDCSECDAMVSKQCSYCPGCGAKMDGGR